MFSRNRLLLVIPVLIIGVVVWGYATRQLPFGLSQNLPPPGSFAAPPATTPGLMAAGQPAVLGAVSYAVVSVQRGQDPLNLVETADAPGPFLIVQVQIRNNGRDPIKPTIESFELIDDQGRRFDADSEASKAAASQLRRRIPGTSVQPGTAITTALAFEAPAEATGLALEVSIGKASMALPEG